MRPIPEIAVEFVAKKEALRCEAYQDSGGVWTIGYGHIEGVRKGDVCTAEQAWLWLGDELIKARSLLVVRLNTAVLASLNDNQFAALLSFVYNAGAGKDWTIWEVLNAREWERVPYQLERFVFAGGKVIPGLMRRRLAEVELWKTPVEIPTVGGALPTTQET